MDYSNTQSLVHCFKTHQVKIGYFGGIQFFICIYTANGLIITAKVKMATGIESGTKY